jgi:hypothetical protein
MQSNPPSVSHPYYSGVLKEGSVIAADGYGVTGVNLHSVMCASCRLDKLTINILPIGASSGIAIMSFKKGVHVIWYHRRIPH